MIGDCGSRIADLQPGLEQFYRRSLLDREWENGKSAMKRKAHTFTISAVAEQFDIHPQTLRLYEREGLLKPSRSDGNTRLYTDADLERLEVILSLTRDLGVNLAGVEIILNMREKMDAMQREFERFFHYLQG